MQLLLAAFARQKRNQWVAVGATLAVLLGVVAYLAYHERELTLSRERDRLLTQARVIDENIGLQLAGANAALVSVRDDMAFLRRDGLRVGGSRRLRALTDAMPGVRTMLVTDAQGIVQASNREEALGASVAQRPYFKLAQAHPKADTLYVTEPFKTALNVFSLNLVRTWTDDNGEFAGVIAATLDPEYFQVLLHSVLYTDDMRAALVHGQGKVLMSLPSNKGVEGLNLAVPGSMFSWHRDSGLRESLWMGPAYATGDDRLAAFRTTPTGPLHMDQPMVVIVNRAAYAVLAPWRQLASLYGLVYALLATLLFASVYLLQRKQKEVLDQTLLREQDARDHAERMDLALAGADLGLWDLDIETGVRTVNGRAQSMLGCGPQDPVDNFAAWLARRHPEDTQAATDARIAHERRETAVLVSDYRVRHKNGEWVWIHSRGQITRRNAVGEASRATGTYLDITERKTAEARIAELAFYDALTKLPNRRLLMDRLVQAQLASARSRKPGAVMFLDLDRFKWINDTLGHDMGDLLLQQIAQRLQACVRQTDTVARIGGDEFVMVVHHLGDTLGDAPAHARRMADKVLAALRQPVQLGMQQHAVTTSIGIALFQGDGEPASLLLKQADQAMYQAKAAGRNMASVHDPLAADADA